MTLSLWALVKLNFETFLPPLVFQVLYVTLNYKPEVLSCSAILSRNHNAVEDSRS